MLGMFRKATVLILSVSIIITQPVFAQGAAQLDMGKYLGQMSSLQAENFRPAHLRYISYDAKSNDFKLLLDPGDTKLPSSQNSQTPELQNATQELFNYFLIGLSLPNDKFWVNLRPDAPQQIIDPELEKTNMGRIMLEADLQLKKDTASLTSPQNPAGKEYWDKLYKRAGELFGAENITIPTITRPWIVPGEVIIRESEDSSYIYKANLKVMLEEDYLNNQKTETPKNQKTDYSFSDPRMKELNEYSTQLIKELILPKLTQEVNTGKRYAGLRQVFFSLVLARWFKDRYRSQSDKAQGLSPTGTAPFLNLIDSHNLDNLASKEAWSKEYYFNEYKKSFQQGEYDLKEEITTPTGQVIRSYVSGGIRPVLKSKDINSFKAAIPISEKWIVGGLVGSLVGLGIFSTIIMVGILNNNVRIRVDILSSADLSKIKSSIIRYMLSESEIDTILFAINKDIYETFSQADFKTLENFREWVNEQKGIAREKKDKIEEKLNTLEEKMRPWIRMYLGGISQELNSFKESSNSVKTDRISLSMLTRELFKELTTEGDSIKDFGGLIEFINQLVMTFDTAYTQEKTYLEKLNTPVPNNIKELFDNAKQGLEGIKLQVYRAVQEIGSSPLTQDEVKKSDASSAINEQDMAKEFYDDYIMGSSEFLVGNLDVPKLRNALTDNRLANKIMLQKLGLTATTVNTASENALLDALNEILKMRDFHSKIDIDIYKSIISNELQQLLSKAQASDPSITDKDYSRLNRALLEAIYPLEIRKSHIMNGEYQKQPAFSNVHNVQDMQNILVSLFKNNIFKKYQQPRGTEVETARKIVEDYFLIEFNQVNPKDSKIILKEAGASSAVTKFHEITNQAISILSEIYQEKGLESARKALDDIKTSFNKYEKADERVKILFDIVNIMNEANVESFLEQREQLMNSYESVWDYLYIAAEQGKIITARNSIAKIKQFVPEVVGRIQKRPDLLLELKKYVDFRETKGRIFVETVKNIGEAMILLKAIYGFLRDDDKALALDKQLLEDVWFGAIQNDYDKMELSIEVQDKNEGYLTMLHEDRQNWLDRKVPLFGYRLTTTLMEFGASSAIVQELSGLEVEIPLEQQVGGIDFTQINYLLRPMGSFQGLDLRLPLLSQAELEGMDINRELAAVEQMINAKIEVSSDRLKRLLAAMSQEDAFSAQRETQLLPLLLRLCRLKEERGTETTPEFRAVLLIADTGLFVEQGKEKYSLN